MSIRKRLALREYGVQARVVRQIRRRNKSEQEGGRKGTTPRLR